MEPTDQGNEPRESTDERGKAIAEILHNPELPRYYANGFTTALGNSDVSLILQQHGRPVAIVHLSFVLAKTLAQKLGQAIVELETDIEISIPTTDLVEKKRLEKQKEENE